MNEVLPDPGRSVRSLVGKAALIILGATLVGRALGLLRDIVIAYFWARGETDAFFLAYRIPVLLALMVAGALTAAFVPLFSYRLATGRKKEAWDLSVNVGNIICVTLIVITVVLIAVAPWLVAIVGFGLRDTSPATIDTAVFLFRILMIGFLFEGITGLFVGMLNSLRRFAVAAFAPAAGTVSTLVITVAFARSLGITSLAIGTVVGWVVGLAVLLPGLRDQELHYRFRIDWHDPAVREVGGMVWPILLGSAVGKISIFSDQVLGGMLGSGAISSLNYADKLFQLPLGLFVAGITIPIFPLLSEQVAAKAPERIKATLDFALRLMGFLLVPATVGLILLRYPIIGLLLEHGEFTADDTSRTAWALLFLCLGLYVYAGRDTLTRVFYAHHDTRTPVKISAATVVVNVGLSYLFMQFLGVGGLTLGTTAALTVNFVVLFWLLRRKIGVIGFRRTGFSLLRVIGASAFMGAVVWAVDYFLAGAVGATFGGNALRVVIGIVAGVVAFLLAAKLVKIPELAETVDMLRAVFKRQQREDKSA
ncbi:MAG: murein biosynthesis integral membrane protein MurJ [Actinobacteria bacterium RBG_16_64_13]|nr:MAG: murein biosynthesis integral membrane protein MurJ [Actinobacteria bacterium RBG_16_64_13]